MDKAEDLAQKLFEFNFRIAHWNLHNYNNEFKVNGKGKKELTSRQYSMLLFIGKMKLRTVTEIEYATRLSRSSISLTLSRLVEDGYLEKKQPSDDEDGRKVYFELTAKAEKVLEEVTIRIMYVFTDFYKSLDENKKKDLEEGISLLENIF